MGAAGGSGATSAAGGSGATTGAGGSNGTAGAGGGSPGGGSECALGCEQLGGTCGEQGCVVEVETLVTSLQESSYLLGGQAIDLASADAKLYPAGTALPSFTVLASDGPCAAVTYAGPPPNPPSFDVGTVTAGGPMLPSTVLTAPKYHQSLPDAPNIFAPGDTMTVTVSGGADFPGFTAEAVAPEELEMVVPDIVVSQPLTITWSPATPPEYVTIFTSAKGILCHPDKPGSVEIAPALLAQLDSPASVSHAAVTGVRLVSVEASVGSPGQAARVTITKSRSFDVGYGP